MRSSGWFLLVGDRKGVWRQKLFVKSLFFTVVCRTKCNSCWWRRHLFDDHFPRRVRIGWYQNVCILDFIRASGWWRWRGWQLELVRRATSSSHITTNKPTLSFLQTDALLATQPTVSTLKGKYSTDLLTWGLPVLYLSTKGSWLLMGESCQASREPSDASTPVYSTFVANWSWA